VSSRRCYARYPENIALLRLTILSTLPIFIHSTHTVITAGAHVRFSPRPRFFPYLPHNLTLHNDRSRVKPSFSSSPFDRVVRWHFRHSNSRDLSSPPVVLRINCYVYDVTKMGTLNVLAFGIGARFFEVHSNRTRGVYNTAQR